MILLPHRLSLRSRAFTLPELQIAVAIMMFVIAGTIMSHIAGQKYCESIKGKLSNADQSTR